MHLTENALKKISPFLKFPDELEKKYNKHHFETRLIISNRLLFAGYIVFMLFSILDYIVFPFYAAAAAWIIRGVTALFIFLIFFNRRFNIKKTPLPFISIPVILINLSVVAIDVIGVNSAGYDQPLGSLFVIIASCVLLRLPFRISLYMISIMVTTQYAGLIFFTGLTAPQIINNFFHFFFIIIMVLFSNYCTDLDSRKIYLLNLLKRKYEKSGLNKEKTGSYVEQLERYMIENKPFIDPDVRIEDIALALSIKRHYLTQIINE